MAGAVEPSSERLPCCLRHPSACPRRRTAGLVPVATCDTREDRRVGPYFARTARQPAQRRRVLRRGASLMRTYARTRAVTLLVSALLAGAESTAHAQYFGRNKVQYKTFQFETLTTDHFRVYFYPEEREAAGDLARMAERWYARLSKFFGHELSTQQPLVAYASSPDFRQTNVIGGQIGEGTGGVTE